jgi:hypothetical protein
MPPSTIEIDASIDGIAIRCWTVRADPDANRIVRPLFIANGSPTDIMIAARNVSGDECIELAIADGGTGLLSPGRLERDAVGPIQKSSTDEPRSRRYIRRARPLAQFGKDGIGRDCQRRWFWQQGVVIR